MINRISITLIAAAVLLVLGSLAGTARQSATSGNIRCSTPTAEGTLAKMGQEGWEVAAAYVTEPNQVRIIMERRRN